MVRRSIPLGDLAGFTLTRGNLQVLAALPLVPATYQSELLPRAQAQAGAADGIGICEDEVLGVTDVHSPHVPRSPAEWFACLGFTCDVTCAVHLSIMSTVLLQYHFFGVCVYLHQV